MFQLPGRHRSSVALWACLTAGALAQQAAETPPRLGSLADYVPIETQLYFEVADVEALSQTQAGAAVGRVVGWLAREMGPASGRDDPRRQGGERVGTGPVEAWQRSLAEALGLKSVRTAELLLAGPLAVAADDWQHLSSAILVARPHEAAALESILEPRRLPGPERAPVRRYRLAHGHELTCDGQVVDAADLYARATRLLASGRGLCLNDLAEFRERLAELPAGADGVFYFSTHLRKRIEAEPRPTSWWSLLGLPVRSLALALAFDDAGLSVEATGRLQALSGPVVAHDPPIDALLFLPDSTVAAWTYPIPYVRQFEAFKRTHRRGVARVYLEMLEWQMEPNALRDRLLAHLVGDTVIVVGQVAIRPSPDSDNDETLSIPTLALLVETDDPEAVRETMQVLARNIVRVTNLLPGSEAGNRIHTEPVSDEVETAIFSIDLSPLTAGGPRAILRQALQLAWCVADGRLIVASHPESVRQIVLAQRGQVPLMPAEAIQQAMSRQRPPHRLPDMVLVAQPRVASAMIDSWLGYIERHYPEMFEPTWWQRLRRRYRARQAQLGIRPAAGATRGIVVVAETLPGWPADGRLRAGDQIVAVDGKPLDEDRALQSLRDRIALREREDRIVLSVVRAGREVQVTIPMPVSPAAAPVQPLALLRQIAELARTFDVASYVTWQPSRGLVQTRLDLRLPQGKQSPAVVNGGGPAEVAPEREAPTLDTP